jgi:hypothetical protein
VARRSRLRLQAGVEGLCRSASAAAIEAVDAQLAEVLEPGFYEKIEPHAFGRQGAGQARCAPTIARSHKSANSSQKGMRHQGSKTAYLMAPARFREGDTRAVLLRGAGGPLPLVPFTQGTGGKSARFPSTSRFTAKTARSHDLRAVSAIHRPAAGCVKNMAEGLQLWA